MEHPHDLPTSMHLESLDVGCFGPLHLDMSVMEVASSDLYMQLAMT